jgi:cytochrome P450
MTRIVDRANDAFEHSNGLSQTTRPRACIGAQFALTEATRMLVKLIAR